MRHGLEVSIQSGPRGGELLSAFFHVAPIGLVDHQQLGLWSVILVYVWKNVGFTMLTTSRRAAEHSRRIV